jgi:hypothetical protein
MYTARNPDGTWVVVDDQARVLASGFAHEQDAWEWMDEREDEEQAQWVAKPLV